MDKFEIGDNFPNLNKKVSEWTIAELDCVADCALTQAIEAKDKRLEIEEKLQSIKDLNETAVLKDELIKFEIKWFSAMSLRKVIRKEKIKRGLPCLIGCLPF
ncbi:MAG TPA: hypothetical protein ENN28_04005 [Candidatus Uhrbacteria bacterium]|nr:hypothetical protein [Candidatus Uhrbacteria bacterium]